MKALWRLATLAGVATALAVPASAQIISTSLPTAKAGAARDKFSMHIMATPFAKWDYKEVFFYAEDYPTYYYEQIGTVEGTPNSDFMAAAEMAFALGESNWSMTVGGWYNKIGQNDFAFDGSFYYEDFFSSNQGTVQADVPIDLTMYEGHLGVFYKAVGVQGGVVKTNQKVGDQWKNIRFNGVAVGDLQADLSADESTTDWTVFGVVRKSTPRWGVSAGAGAYFKQGIEQNSPLRFADDQVVFSGFVTGNVNVFKGLGIDVSYWYIGKTGDLEALAAEFDLPAKSSDSQSRFTVGIGYSF